MATPTAAALLNKCDDFIFIASKLDEALTKLASKNVIDSDVDESDEGEAYDP